MESVHTVMILNMIVIIVMRKNLMIIATGWLRRQKMTKFDNLMCTIMSTPVVEMESPFYLSFDVKVQNDVVPAIFIGNFAHALKNTIRIGEKAIIRDGFIDNGKLVFDFLHLEPHTAIGRNVDIVC